MCETRDGSSAPNRSRLAGALPLLVRAASRAVSAAFPVRRHSVKAFRSLLPDLRSEAALVLATPPSVSSCVALAALSPRVLSSGQLSTLSADAGAPLRRTPSPPSESAAPVPAPDMAAAPAPVMTDECGRVGRGGERLRALRARGAQRLGRPAAAGPPRGRRARSRLRFIGCTSYLMYSKA